MDIEDACRNAQAEPSTAASRLHIANCDKCADQLTLAFLESTPSVSIPPRFAADVSARVAASPRPQGPRRRGRTLALALSAVVAAGTIAASDGLLARYGFGLLGLAAACSAIEATALIWWLGRTPRT